MKVLRLLRVYTRRHDAPTLGHFDEVHEEFRVGLSDIDLHLHLDNASYRAPRAEALESAEHGELG